MSDKRSVGDLASKGIVWLTGQSVFARFVSYFSQLALAWFLTEDDFGLFGLALTISEFSRVFNQGGVSKILIYRQKSFAKWVTPGFWLSLTISVLVSLSMIIAGYFASSLFQTSDPVRLFQLVCLLAVLPPISSIGSIPRAALEIKLRFGTIAIVSTFMLLINAVSKVGLAWGGFGAFSFVIPSVIVTAVQTAAYWFLGRVKIHPRLMIRKWKYLLSNGAMIVVTSFWYKIITHGDYVILGVMATQKEQGLYFFAFTYSVQAVVMFTQGVASVSFPALSSLNQDPSRQLAAFRKGATVLAALVFPASVAQAVLFKPVIEEFFPVIWIPAIAMLQLLSLGMAAKTVSWISASLMESQGRFRTRMWLGLVSAIVFLVMGVAGATLGKSSSFGAPLGLAIAVTVYYPIMSFATVWVALPKESDRLSIIQEICLAPAVISFLAFVPTYLIAVAISNNNYVHIAATALIGSTIYVVVARSFMKAVWEEVIKRCTRLIGKIPAIESAKFSKKK